MTATEGYGFKVGHIVQEFGYDEDVDFDFREAVEEATGEPLEDEDYRGIADQILAWWRAEDGVVDDLTDYLVDCTGGLDDGGDIWLVVPARGSQLFVPTNEIEEAATAAGMTVTTSHGLETGWTAFRVSTRHRRA